MSFGTLVGQIIFALIFIFALVILVTVLTQGTNNIDDAYKIRAQLEQQRLHTNIHVSASQQDDETVHINITNTGQTIIDPAQLDIYLNNQRIQRNDSNAQWIYTIDTANPRLLDPQDTFTYSYIGVDTFGTNRALVITANGIHAADIFTFS